MSSRGGKTVLDAYKWQMKYYSGVTYKWQSIYKIDDRYYYQNGRKNGYKSIAGAKISIGRTIWTLTILTVGI